MKIKPLALAMTLFAATAPFSVNALMCEDYSAKTSLNALMNHDAKIVVFAGYLKESHIESEFREVKEPNELLSTLVPLVPHPVTHSITGGQISGDEGLSYVTENVSIAETCVLQWCGYASVADGPKLLILWELDGAFVGEMSACGGSIFPMPSPKQIGAIQQCLRDGACTEGTEILDDLLSPYSTRR